MKGTPEELREAGISALKRQDFSTAATLLQRAADQDPTGARDGKNRARHMPGSISMTKQLMFSRTKLKRISLHFLRFDYERRIG